METCIKRTDNGESILREKPLILILFVASIILIAAFFLVTPSFISENGEYKHFEDNDISFDMYNSWTVYEYDDTLKKPFLSTSPDSIILNPVDKSQFSFDNGQEANTTSDGVINTATTNAYDVAIVKTEISKVKSLPDGVTLDDAYKSDSLYSLMNSSGQFQLINDTAITVSDRPAHQFIYQVSGTTYHDTWVEADGYYLRIDSQAPGGFMNDVKPQFDYLISTLKIK